tara:strand:+ start:664 stop:1449 length:786 start_codon:yes stop_codon:yes gene_type:complete
MNRRQAGIEATLTKQLSKGGKCLVPYITGGYTGYLEAISAAAEAGADAIEIGIPFSDPVMDGPTIQMANDEVLAKGITPAQILHDIGALDVDVPLAVMTYYNVVYRFGLERFANTLKESSISGAIIPDLPLIEAKPWIEAAEQSDIETILLAAPTTTDVQLRDICQKSKGFVYAVGLLGITGAREELADSATVIADRCKKITDKPVLVGVGIGNPEQAKNISNVSDGCIVGSAIVQKLLDGGGAESVGNLVGLFRAALDAM